MAGNSELDDVPGLVESVNVPANIAAVISLKPNLYPALCSTLGLEDLHDILEVIRIDAHNARVLRKAREEK